MSSVLNSVFKGRKGKRSRFNLTHRAQSPSSPGSFVSPDNNEKPFNPYSLIAASQSSLNQHLQRHGDRQPSESSKRVSSPKVNVDIGTEGFSLSDWFTSDLLQPRADLASLPERNASLGVKAGTGSVNGSSGNLSMDKGADSGLHRRGTSESAASQAGPQANAASRNLPIPPRTDEGSYLQARRAREKSFSEDDVIVIEAPRGRDPTLSPLSSRFNIPEAVPEARDASVPRRPAPAPLKIPVAGTLRPRAASLESSHPDKQTYANISPISRHPSLTRSRSRLRSRSRPASAYSRYSDTDIDYDENISAVSGTTLARALVSSYILSSSSSFAGPSSGAPQYARSRGHLARQDSATLPRGELPFFYNRTSIRSSKGSLAASSRVGSTYWRDRRISGDQIVVVSPEERDGWGGDGDVPPVPPMPAGLSPGSSPYGSSRKPLPNPSEGRRENSAGLTAEWRRSNGARPALTELVLDNAPDRKRRRISKISEASGSQASTAPGAPSIHPTITSRSHDSLPLGDEKAQESKDDIVHESQGVLADKTQDASGVGHAAQPKQHLQEIPTTAESMASSQDTPGYNTPALSQTQSATSAESSVHTPASAALRATHIRTRMSRSYSEYSPRRSMGPRPNIAQLPIGERPRSEHIQSPFGAHLRSSSDSMTRPYSMASPLLPPVMPGAAGDSPDSPDLLDIMLAGTRVVQRSHGIAGTRIFSPPAPISVPSPPSPYGFLEEDPSLSSSAVRQTFPETPYAFTPLVSAGFATPQLPQGAPLPARSTSTAVRSMHSKAGIGKQALMRHATMMSPPNSAELASAMTPPPSGSDNPLVSADEIANFMSGSKSAGVLSMIEEGSTPGSPTSELSSYSNTPDHSPAPLARSRPVSKMSLEVSNAAAERPASLIPAKRSLTPLPSPPPTSFPLPLSPLPSPSHPEHNLEGEKTLGVPLGPLSDDESVEHFEGKSLSSSPALPPATLDSPVIVQPVQKPGPQPLPSAAIKTGPRGPRSRPPPPSGPRRPSVGAAAIWARSRSRAGSVSSSVGTPSASSSTSNTTHLFAKGSTPTFSASSPRFQAQPVQFRGLTMEAAQWTWAREQLQDAVSAAIKKSADASSIRLLPAEMLNEQIPEEIERLEALSAEIRTNYKVAVRKRRMLLGSLRSTADGGELAEQAASTRIVDDLSDLSDHVDHLSEELYVVTDQLSQLRHLQDVHFGSALAMGLRKLNSAFVKHLAEKESLRQQVATLEADREEAWRLAQEAARELDELSEKVAMSDGVVTPASSRRSSKVSIARKASLRKANLRSPSRLRSQRSSVASRSSMALSPSMRTGSSGDIPPVPPIPMRAPLMLSTSDLPIRSSGLTSEDTPLSEIRAMQQAQEELCEMLGISPEDLRGPAIETRHKRSRSHSAAMQSPRSPRSFASRTKSEIYTPNTSASDSFRIHHRSRTIDDRTAVLASIGMASA